MAEPLVIDELWKAIEPILLVKPLRIHFRIQAAG